MGTVSRMQNLIDVQKTDEKGKLREGECYFVLLNTYNLPRIGVITRWNNGYLHSEGGLPAVEFEDTHIEFWSHGKLHNTRKNDKGEWMPAVLADYMNIEEYWVEGKRISNPNLTKKARV